MFNLSAIVDKNGAEMKKKKKKKKKRKERVETFQIKAIYRPT